MIAARIPTSRLSWRCKMIRCSEHPNFDSDSSDEDDGASP
jgi:hypothetical protein